MRPSAFANGNKKLGMKQRWRSCDFNEAVGFRQRKSGIAAAITAATAALQ